MGFGQAISTCLRKYATFQGRARRSEFWWWVLLLFVIGIITNLLDNVFGTNINYSAYDTLSSLKISQGGWISAIVGLALFIPTLAVSVRRLHDTGKSGWWWWLNVLCCIGSLILLIFYVTKSDPMPNKYGDVPA